MSKKLPFRPIIGTNAQILAQDPTEGCLWFATDSKKIYYSDGASFLSMGGNTGIYYGVKNIPEDTDSDETEFIFYLSEIDGNDNVANGNYKIPNSDDLILNIPDGSFYRVDSVIELNGIVQINTTRLTIAGGGGAIGPSTGTLLIEDIDKNPTKYYTKDTKQALLQFKVNNPISLEGNGIAKIRYSIGALATVEFTDYRDFGLVEFDLLPYISRMTTSTYTTVKVYVEDVYGTKKSYDYYINVIELALSSNDTNSILMTSDGSYTYKCTPMGGSSLANKEVIISFYDSNNNHLKNNDIITPIAITNTAIPIEIKVPQIGAFTMTVTYRGTLPNKEFVNSNILSYQIVYYSIEPQLVVNVPTTRIEQYSTLDITYMIAAQTDSVDEVEVKLYKSGVESVQSVKYNVLNTWHIYFDTPGFYNLSIEAMGITKTYPNIEVYEYSGEIPAINTVGLTLNLSAINRSNTELNRDTWTYYDKKEDKTYECSFNNFAWGSINGWMKDDDGQDVLRLTAGAKMEVFNFFPFDTNPMDFQNGSGRTIELDFKISGVTDFEAGLIECLSYQNEEEIQTGFQITGQGSTMNTWNIKATHGTIKDSGDAQDQIYNTQIQGCTAKFIENERIHLTWVIEDPKNDFPMIRTYLNGILSGITQYGAEDSMLQNIVNPAKIIFNSEYGNIDIYNIRVYKNLDLSDSEVLNNYIATCGTIDERTKKYISNSNVLADDNTIRIETIEEAALNNNYILSVPYIKIIGGQGMEKDDEGYYLDSTDTELRLPNAKKDYRLIEKYEFIDMSKQRQNQTLESSFDENGYLNGIAMYGQGTSSMEYPVKNLRFKAKMRIDGKKVKFPVNDCDVDLVCLKADYMESSGSHNTGTGNLIYTLTEAMKMKTPGQEYWQNKVDYKVVTAIRGFPVLVFFKEAGAAEETPYEFIGKYNFNLDKATHEPFGFQHDKTGTFGWDPDGYKPVNIKDDEVFSEYPFDLYKIEEDNFIKVNSYEDNVQYYSIKNHIHCFEFLNNPSNLANFLADENETFEDTFYKEVVNEGKKVPNWYVSYESRYPEFKDAASTEIDAWFRLCNWINSTKNDINKFKDEFNDYLDFDFTCFYYVLTHVLLMIDSRAKNMMMATWDNTHWYPIFYDMDTMLGLNNYGFNKFNYDVEDTHVNIYNGQASILWNNFREAFPDEIKEFYQRMQTNGLTYNNLLKNYNNNQADAVNENIYNKDSKYKYIRPFTESFIDNSKDEPIIVEPGDRDYLYASQGNRSMHRKWWLYNRMNYFNGKYLSNAYKDDKYILRLYTPQKGMEIYLSVGTITEEQFNSNIYYIQQIDNDTGDISYIKAISYDESSIYYKKETDNPKLNDSLEAVVPNSDFTLTPLNNQYLSIAFGGDNGVTTSPQYVKANTPQLIEAPSGAVYNDSETYLYGGSMLKDLGDLSYQYLGRFAFPEKETKLEKLTLGNPNNLYYNPNFSMLTIGSAAPYLKELEISNCIGLKGRSISVSQCKNIQKIYATGTDITNIVLPAYGVLQELRLPETIVSLTLIEQTQLTSDKFTIGTCSYDPLTGKRTYTDNSEKIILLRVENTPIDSYSLVKTNPLQQFYLKDINWVISDVDDLNEDKTEIRALEKLLSDNVISAITNQTKSQSLIGTITLSASLGLTESQAMNLYSKYCKATVFPNISFVFEGLNIYDVIILNGNGTTLWSKKIVANEEGNIDITEDFLKDTTFGEFKLPTKSDTIQFVYNFTNEWEINNLKYDCSDSNGWPVISDITPPSGGNNIILTPIFDEQIKQYTITFINPYDEQFKISQTVNYGTLIKNILPTEIPYRDTNDDLDLKETFKHIGYNIFENATVGYEFTDNDVVTQNNTYYTIFEKVSVYNNVHEEYFDFIDDSFIDPGTKKVTKGYKASLKSNVKNSLRGKVTIPAEYKGLPVISVSNFSTPNAKGDYDINDKITHVFISKNSNNSTNLLKIENHAFRNCSKLEYFDFLCDSLRVIGNNAFQQTSLKLNDFKDENSIKQDIFTFGKNLYAIHHMAFNQLHEQEDPWTVIIPSSVVVIDARAFSYGDPVDRDINIQIGTETEASQLDLTKGVTDKLPDGTNCGIFDYNYDIISSVIFYTNTYNQWADKITRGDLKETVFFWFGGNNAKSQVTWTLNNNGIHDEITIP